MKSHTLIAAGLTTLALAAMTLPAMAYCPSLPDGPDSNNVTNGQQRAVCLQEQLNASTNSRNAQTQFDSLKSSIEQQQIQRRIDSLPIISRPPPWERR